MIITIPETAITADLNRLTNQIWKLIPMRENEENWSAQLDSLIIEIAGLSRLSDKNTDEKCLILLSKLKGLQTEETNFQIYRKTVFECISLLREMRL